MLTKIQSTHLFFKAMFWWAVRGKQLSHLQVETVRKTKQNTLHPRTLTNGYQKSWALEKNVSPASGLAWFSLIYVKSFQCCKFTPQAISSFGRISRKSGKFVQQEKHLRSKLRMQQTQPVHVQNWPWRRRTNPYRCVPRQVSPSPVPGKWQSQWEIEKHEFLHHQKNTSKKRNQPFYLDLPLFGWNQRVPQKTYSKQNGGEFFSFSSNFSSSSGSKITSKFTSNLIWLVLKPHGVVSSFARRPSREMIIHQPSSRTKHSPVIISTNLAIYLHQHDVIAKNLNFWTSQQLLVTWTHFFLSWPTPIHHGNRQFSFLFLKSPAKIKTHLKNISQIGNLPQIGVKIKNPPIFTSDNRPRLRQWWHLGDDGQPRAGPFQARRHLGEKGGLRRLATSHSHMTWGITYKHD